MSNGSEGTGTSGIGDYAAGMACHIRTRLSRRVQVLVSCPRAADSRCQKVSKDKSAKACAAMRWIRV